jgi:hypothetical protein
MTDRLRKKIIVVMILSLCIILIAIPVSAEDVSRCTRSYNLVLLLSPLGVTEQAVQLVYGSSLHPADAPGDLRGKVLSRDGRILQEFPLWDPRIQFGEDIVVDEKGNVTKVSGILKQEKKATLAVMFQHSPDAVTFALYNAQGSLMKSVDLSRAEDKATWNCTPDYGIPSRNFDGGLSSVVPIVVIAVLVVLVVAAGAGWYFLKKRSGEKHQ